MEFVLTTMTSVLTTMKSVLTTMKIIFTTTKTVLGNYYFFPLIFWFLPTVYLVLNVRSSKHEMKINGTGEKLKRFVASNSASLHTRVNIVTSFISSPLLHLETRNNRRNVFSENERPQQREARVALCYWCHFHH